MQTQLTEQRVKVAEEERVLERTQKDLVELVGAVSQLDEEIRKVSVVPEPEDMDASGGSTIHLIQPPSLSLLSRPDHSQVSSTQRNSTAARFEPVDLTTLHLDRAYVSQHSCLTRPGPRQPIAAHVSQFVEDSAELGR